MLNMDIIDGMPRSKSCLYNLYNSNNFMYNRNILLTLTCLRLRDWEVVQMLL